MSDSSSGAGCLRPLLISAGVMLVLFVGMAAWNWGTVSLMLGNMTALSEGGDAAERLTTPDSLLAYLARHPARASLAVYDVPAGSTRAAGGPAGGNALLRHRAEAARTLTGVPSLLWLSEYARQVEAGRLDPDARVALDSVARLSLPNVNAASHARAVRRLREAGHLRADARGDTTAALRHWVRAAARFGDEAAADWLMLRLGRAALDSVPARLGLPAADPPVPSSGLRLAWVQAAADSTANADGPTAGRRAAATDRAWSLTRRLRRDTAFRGRWQRRFARRGARLGLHQQRALALQTYPRGTAGGYATLLTRVLDATAASGEASGGLASGEAARVRTLIERALPTDSAQAPFTAVGSKGGAFPGVLALAGYARRPGRPDRVAVLFLEDLPIGVFYRLQRSGLARGVLLGLLGDDAFVEAARRRLRGAAPSL